MADDDFRPYRGRDPLPRDEADLLGNDANDPLAELARLIGQKDPYADAARPETGRSERSRDDAETSSGGDWADEETYAEEDDHREDERYAAPQPSSAASYQAYEPQERGDENAPPPAPTRYLSGPAAQFSGFRDGAEPEYREERQSAPRPRELPAYATAEPEDDYESAPAQHDDSEAYADDHYNDYAPPRRRSGLVLIMAVFGLAVIGTAGAFGYRAMFGGSLLPSLPPIIKASNGPNKIVPNSAESQAKSTSPDGTSSGGSTVHLVSREEQPVAMEPPKVIPRVVATVPVSGSNTVPTAAPLPAAPPSPAAPSPTVAASNAPPPVAPAAAPQAPAVAAPATSAPAASPASTAPKRIHTVIIHADENGTDTAAAPAAEPPPATPPSRSQVRAVPPAPKPAPKTSVVASAPPTPRGNAPLSIMPGSEGEAPAPAPARSHAPAGPISLASAGPVAGVAAAPSSGHGYDVQVTSQRSEADAQAEFRALRAKYPNQLGSREPIIRRADLGAKGTYYRAMVGPFASLEEAAGMCSRLKAAGGSCLVQRN
jgi:hypothetical protein